MLPSPRLVLCLLVRPILGVIMHRAFSILALISASTLVFCYAPTVGQHQPLSVRCASAAKNRSIRISGSYMESKAIVAVLSSPGPHWVGDGFPVRTIFSAHANDARAISPFLLLDYAGPHSFPASADGKPRGVDEHPHRGFETVTIVYQGELEHRDSGGHSGKIGPGDVQWMTAASGVVHEEKHAAGFTRRGGTLEMVQLWVNLPAREKMASPRYQEILASSIPLVHLPHDASTLRVIAGQFDGQRGPAKTVTPINVWDMQLRAGGDATFKLPPDSNTLVLILRGQARVGTSRTIRAHECAVLSREGESLNIQAIDDSAILLLNGEPIDEPVVAHGPFVMNTRAEIEQAMRDYHSGQMGRLEPVAD
jgi:redox-sensitive bicupin YhaK (pirin superfamily)